MTTVTSTTQCLWHSHAFGVYPPRANWSDASGIYIFAKQTVDARWQAIYIGQALHFRDRLAQHERAAEAFARGMTHIHAMVVRAQQDRDLIERFLIQQFKPPLNVQLRG
jgi:excinuclease UvrABC nuclease subunit